MKKIQLSQLTGQYKFIQKGETASVYLLSDGRFLKLYNLDILNLLKMMGIDIEKKILDSANRKMPSEIIKPSVAVYDGNYFVGTIIPPARGINYNVWNDNLTVKQRADLSMYADMYSKLEGIVRSTPDIVYPDICSCDNIYVSDSGIQLIDYEGLQIGSYPSIGFSTTLGDVSQYFSSSKYSIRSKSGSMMPLFTKELDKKSLILLYFLTTFNMDLNKVGAIEPHSGKRVTLDDFFDCINLQDYDLMHKVWKIFQEKEKNEWLGNDPARIAEDYEMVVLPVYVGNSYIKKLVRK